MIQKRKKMCKCILIIFKKTREIFLIDFHVESKAYCIECTETKAITCRNIHITWMTGDEIQCWSY